LQFLHDLLAQEGPDAILNLDDDQLFTEDDRFPEHWSGNLFRVYPGDRFATHFVAHCPEACARSERVVRLTEPVVNFGYMDAEVRAEYWTKYKRAGKIDAHTLALIREPDLKEFKWQSPAPTP
jgi:hypothetical protein